jgi:hypothetical protein
MQRSLPHTPPPKPAMITTLRPLFPSGVAFIIPKLRATAAADEEGLSSGPIQCVTHSRAVPNISVNLHILNLIFHTSGCRCFSRRARSNNCFQRTAASNEVGKSQLDFTSALSHYAPLPVQNNYCALLVAVCFPLLLLLHFLRGSLPDELAPLNCNDLANATLFCNNCQPFHPPALKIMA